MKKRYWAFLIGSWCLSVGMQAAKVDTLSVHSDAMNKEVQVITICPDKAMAGEKCPVLYREPEPGVSDVMFWCVGEL